MEHEGIIYSQLILMLIFNHYKERKQANAIKQIREREVKNTMLETYDRIHSVSSNIMREYLQLNCIP